MEPMLVHVTEILQRLSNRVDTFSIELCQVRDHVDNGFIHFEGRDNKSRETEKFLSRRTIEIGEDARDAEHEAEQRQTHQDQEHRYD
jgi:hypothetical protein